MLQLNHIAWTASDGKQVLKDVNLNVGDGKLVVITGPNGSGKTTLARLIAGIDTPEAGQIVLNGEDITNLDVTERARRGVSFAFQQPVRFKGITVRQLIETGGQGYAQRGAALRNSRPRGAVRAGLYRPRGQRDALRRRDQAHRDRHGAGAPHAAFRSLMSRRRASTFGASRT